MKCMKCNGVEKYELWLCYEYKRKCHVYVTTTNKTDGRSERMIISLSALNQVQRLRSMPVNAYSHGMAPNP